MATCITEDLKAMLLTMIDKKLPHEVLKTVIDTVMPTCESLGIGSPARAAVAEAKSKRAWSEPWGIKPTYYDEHGKSSTYESPSQLVKHLGLTVSGSQTPIVCDEEGKTCKAVSVVEIMRIHGYTVTADGEPKKASQGGTKMLVYHPDSPQLHELKE